MALQVITPPLTDTALRDLRRRTAARLMAARVEMRAGWLLHPDNAVRRADWSAGAELVKNFVAGVNGFAAVVQAVVAATGQAARALNAMAAQAPTYNEQLSDQVMFYTPTQDEVELLANLRGECRP